MGLSGGGHIKTCPGRERVEFSSKAKAEKQTGTAFLGKQMSLSQHQTVTRLNSKRPLEGHTHLYMVAFSYQETCAADVFMECKWF